jgi:hypothetical protein
MARFHRVGEVFPDALYGHIIITFDVAVLRGQMNDLPRGYHTGGENDAKAQRLVRHA